MADTTGVLARLQAALSVYDPSWDVSVGSATYKILESVSQEIAYANNNSILQTYSYDINTKFGNDLDNFCNLFGVYRQYGKRAVGTVTFSTNTAPTSIINIPLGTQVAVAIGGNYTSPVYFSTTAPAIIPIGTVTTQDVPVIATLPGANGNVANGVITTLVTTLNNITGVINAQPTSGGSDPESDTALRSRWQNTAFNNTTGTNGKYIMTALQNPNVTNANAIGQQNFYDEQLTVQATVSGNSTASGRVTFQLAAVSGMTNVLTGVTYSGWNLIASSGFAASASGSAVQSGIQSMFTSVAPNNNIVVTITPTGNTISGGLNIALSGPSPYVFTIGSGTAQNSSGVTTSGVVTISGVSLTKYVRSLNPDIGASGTLSYNNTYSGYIFPQGNELVGSNLNSASQTVYVPNSDYYYNYNGTTTITGTFSPQLFLTIANPANNSNLFIGNTVEVISEYNPASSRSQTITSGNYVDIFIDGTTAGIATEQTVFTISGMTLTSGNAVNYLNTTNYLLASGAYANTNTSVSGDYYVPFDRQPLINFPSQLSTATYGAADKLFLYNNTTGSGVTYPIALNPYPFITFTGTVLTLSGAGYINPSTNSGSSNYFVTVNNASNFLYPGLALATGVLCSGVNWIYSTTPSGVYLNFPVSATGTNIVMSGKALAYPLYDSTNTKNSVLDMSGLAFDSTTPPSGWPTLPTSVSWVQYQHSYNSDVTDVEALVQQSRPLGVNTLVHQANFVGLNVNVRIVFSAGYSLTTVQSSLINQLGTYFTTFNYLNAISFANLQTQILSVAGVVNAKVTGVDVVATDNTVLSSYSSDFILASNQLPLINKINYTIVGASTF